MTDENDPFVHEVENLVQRCGEIFHGRQSLATGAALADLLAMWLAGHMLPGRPAETDHMREDLLRGHIEVVRQLTVENDRILRARHGVK